MDHLSNDPYSLLIPAFLDVRRTSPRDHGDRQIQLRLQGQFLDRIYFGERKLYTIRPGRYTLRVTNTLHKKDVEFEVKSGETVYFQVGHRHNDLTWFMVMLLGTGWLYTFIEVLAETDEPESAPESRVIRALRDPLMDDKLSD